MEDNILDNRDENNKIGLCAFDCILYEENLDGGGRQLIDEYPYLNHLIELWYGDWGVCLGMINGGL